MAIALPAQTFTVLLNFDAVDGQYPEAGLIQGTDGDLYETTTYGGDQPPDAGFGTVFKITPGGTLTLYSFCAQSGSTDGEYPRAGLTHRFPERRQCRRKCNFSSQYTVIPHIHFERPQESQSTGTHEFYQKR